MQKLIQTLMVLAAVLSVTFSASAEDEDGQTIAVAKEAVAAKMKDGESVRFRKIHVVDKYWVCGEVNGKNSYGAYAGFSRFHVSVYPGDTAENVSVTIEEDQPTRDFITRTCGKDRTD